MQFAKGFGRSFGERLLILIRETPGVTNKVVAKYMCVSETAVGNWTKGGGITDANMFRLARFFNVHWILLRFGSEKMEEVRNEMREESNEEFKIGESELILLRDKIIQGFMDMTDDEVYLISEKSHTFVHVSTSALKNTGYAEKEILNMTPYDIKPDLDKETYIEMCRVVSEHDSISFNTKHLRRDKNQYNVNIQFRKIVSSLGNLYIAVGKTDGFTK